MPDFYRFAASRAVWLLAAWLALGVTAGVLSAAEAPAPGAANGPASGLTQADRVTALQDKGATVVLVEDAGTTVGAIAVRDELRPEAPDVVAALHQRGVHVAMLTGDNAATAAALARQAGVDDVRAELLPDDKISAVDELSRRGGVAMVGDGINDAPALAQADVGIAMGTGTDVAMETADVTLLRGDLRSVPQAIQLSRATMRTIRWNLFWAFIYNVIGIPLAAGVFYPLLGWQLSPIYAAAAMAFSSVFVVSNSLRLRGLRLEATPHGTRAREVMPPAMQIGIVVAVGLVIGAVVVACFAGMFST